MLTLSAYNQTEVAKRITEPFFLLEMSYSTPIRISSRETVTWDARVWTEGYLDVIELDQGDFGDSSALVRISAAFKSQVLSEHLVDIPIQLIQLWGQGPFNTADGEILINGVGYGPQINRDYVVLQIVQIDSRSGSAPRLYYEHQNIQPSGTQLIINSDTITIQKADFL